MFLSHATDARLCREFQSALDLLRTTQAMHSCQMKRSERTAAASASALSTPTVPTPTAPFPSPP
eukprot:1781080-Pleurochrysis_carterae.AAC.1